jgi:hypothetical protein
MTEESENKSGEKLLQTIRGARLSSVQFVLDYLILGFDEKGALTTLVWPEVTSNGLTLKFGAPGYRDCLCALIAHVVEGATIGDDETIRVQFFDGSLIVIKLQGHGSERERAIFTGPKNVLFTW